MRWPEEQRQVFIAQMLRARGRVNRRDIVNHFRVSIQTAAHDLGTFKKAFPGLMTYDATAKAYVRTEPVMAGDDDPGNEPPPVRPDD